MLDHCCEGTFVFKNLRQAKYVKSYGDDLCGGHEPYVSHIWLTGLKTTPQEHGEESYWILSLSLLKSVDTKI